MTAAAVRILAYVLAAALAVFAIGKCSGDDAAGRARTEMHERNAAIVARAYRAARQRTDTVLVAVGRQGGRVDVAVADVREALDSARTVRDTGEVPISADSVLRLMASHHRLTVTVERLVAEVVVYRDSVDVLTLRIAEERADADRTIAAKDRVIASLKAERCTVNLLVTSIPCPTRTQTAVLTAVTVFVVMR